MRFLVFIFLLSSCSISIYIERPLDKKINTPICNHSLNVPSSSPYFDVDPGFYQPYSFFIDTATNYSTSITLPDPSLSVMDEPKYYIDSMAFDSSIIVTDSLGFLIIKKVKK